MSLESDYRFFNVPNRPTVLYFDVSDVLGAK